MTAQKRKSEAQATPAEDIELGDAPPTTEPQITPTEAPPSGRPKPYTPAEALAAATERARQWATPARQEAKAAEDADK